MGEIRKQKSEKKGVYHICLLKAFKSSVNSIT